MNKEFNLLFAKKYLEDMEELNKLGKHEGRIAGIKYTKGQ